MDKTKRAITLLASTAIVMAGMLIPATQAHAAVLDGIEFEDFAVHPYASNSGYICGAEFCNSGDALVDLGVTADGQLIAGYGDWTKNLDSAGPADDRVGVVPLDLASGTWGEFYSMGSEAMDVIREINGNIYIPTTDPSVHAPYGQTRAQSGYMTNKGGEWHFVPDNLNQVHVFDVATLTGSDVWTFGARDRNGASDGEAIAVRSTDGGAMWSVVGATHSTSDPTGFERYYWGAATAGKMFTTPTSINGTQNHLNTIGSTGDGRWQKTKEKFVTTSAADVVNFEGKIVGKFINNWNSISVFDGKKTVSKALPAGESVRDFYVDGETLYILGQKNIYRTNSLDADFELLGKSPVLTTSLAVHDGHMYLGGFYGKVLKSTTSIVDAADPALYVQKITGAAPGIIASDGGTHQVLITGENFGETNRVQLRFNNMSYTGQIIDKTETSLLVEFDTAGWVNPAKKGNSKKVVTATSWITVTNTYNDQVQNREVLKVTY